MIRKLSFFFSVAFMVSGLLLTGLTYAQAAQHSVALTWTDTANPTGTTYNVYRATGLCSGSPVFSKLASAITTKTFTDATVTPGNYCYQVTATFNGAESGASNSVNPSVPAFAPTSLTFTVQ